MAKSGIVNVVCHGTIAYVVEDDGSIELLIPEVDLKWDHHYLGGDWDGNKLMSLDVSEHGYQLSGVRHGDGKQYFDPQTNICQEGPLKRPPQAKLRKLRLPPPKRISSANFIPIDPAEAFENADHPQVKNMKRVSTLTVLAYDCDDVSAVRMKTAGGDDFGWVPSVILDEGNHVANIHIFAEPWTFRPLESGHIPTAPLPFNAMLTAIGGDAGLAMRPPSGPGGSLFGDVDPGPAIPGLPESEKLALSNHAQMVAGGMLNHFHPYDCGGTTVQKPAPPPPIHAHRKKAFAILRNQKPCVLANPQVAVVYWGRPQADAGIDGKIRALLNLDFIKKALAEYGVNAPKYLGSFANPNGNKQQMQDAVKSPATPEHSDIAKGLNDLILAGKLPDPRQTPDLLFLIVAAPGAKSAARGVRGSHNYFYLEVPGGKQGVEQVPVYYGWALQNAIAGSDLTALDNLTWTLSHELLEACTDPRPPNGVVFQGAEICDLAAGLHRNVDGLEITGYFSNSEGKYKTPVGGKQSAQSA